MRKWLEITDFSFVSGSKQWPPKDSDDIQYDKLVCIHCGVEIAFRACGQFSLNETCDKSTERMEKHRLLCQNWPTGQGNVHETAIIDPGAQIGRDTKIWHFSHVMDSAIIGSHCIIGQNCFIAGQVGDRCKIQNNVSVFKGVVIQDDVFIGPSAVFTNVLLPRAYREQKDAFELTLIQSGASVGAGAIIVCGHTIGECAIIGAGSVVTKDVPAGQLWYGNPAKYKGDIPA